jgi:hypothetical protein
MSDDEDLFDVRPASAAAVSVDGIPESEENEEPTTFFGSSDEWMRKFLLPSYQRRVTPKGQSGGSRWAAAWWESTEAMHRIEALWRMWEGVRDKPVELSAWWINHLDAHMSVLLAPGGPFANSTDENRPGEPLPYSPPHRSMFEPDRQP